VSVEACPGIDPAALAACLIGGAEHAGEGTFAVSHPYTGEPIGAAPLLRRSEVDAALDLAASSPPPPSRHERALQLERIAALVAASAEDAARLITWESGLSLHDSRHEIGRALDVFRAAAAEALRDDGGAFPGDVSAGGRRRRGHTLREPVRVVAAITPFNHPLNQVAHKIAPAIAAGAPIVLKPSEKTPLTALWLARVLAQANVPPTAAAIVTGRREMILDAMLAHPAVEVVAFTGGVDTGKAIAGRLGYRRAVLELGGNDPMIVLPDADLDEAAALAVEGATRNSGQRCTAVKRVIAVETVADDLAERMRERCAALVAGDPFDDCTDVGTVIDADAARVIERRVEAAVAAGARLLCGGGRIGALVCPAVLDHVSPASELVAAETFGPVAPIIRVRGLDDAIDVANGTPYGLSASVCTNDLDAAIRCIRELRCGTVNVREVPGWRTEVTPFGGIKDSGLGVKEGVTEAMRAMTTQKLYTLPWG
jgi:putative phosphonoacetaldehyde dehydrogenase